MQYVLTILSSLFDVLFSLLFYYAALRPFKRNYLMIALISFIVGGFLITVFFSFTSLPYLLKSVIMFLWDVALCWYLSNYKLGISILLPTVFFALLYICEFTVPITYSLFFGSEIKARESFLMAYGIVSSRVLLYLSLGIIGTILFYKLKNVDVQHVHMMQWFFLCFGVLLLGGFIATFSYAMNDNKQITHSFLVALPFIFIVLLSVFIILLVSLARETACENQLRAQLVKAEMQLEQQKAMDALYHDIQGLRHDLNNHMQALSGLLERNETEKAFQYVQGITSTTGKMGQWITTKDGAVDALLNAKLHRARDAGIKVWANIQYPDPCDTPRNDVCTILFNLLDNAIEACEKNKDAANRRLRLSTKLIQNFFVIMVENPSEQAPVKTKKGFQSSKAGILHGFGLRQVKEIAQKYGGMFRVEYEETGMFRAAAMLPQNQSEWVNVSIMRPEEEEEQETVEQPEKMQAGTV